MKRIGTYMRSSALVAMIALAGCQQTNQALDGIKVAAGIGPAYTAEERALLEQSRDIVQRSILEGAFFGALGGCALGLAIDGSIEGCLVGAAAGGVAGGVAGAAVGQGNAQANFEIENEEQRIAELNEERQRLEGFERSLTAKIKAQNAELNRLSRSLANDEIDPETYTTSYNRIKSFRVSVADQLDEERAVREGDLKNLREIEDAGGDVSRLKKPTTRNINSLKDLAALSRRISPPVIEDAGT